MKFQMHLVALGCLVAMSAGDDAEESCEDLKMELSRGLQWETMTTWRNLMTLSVSARKCDGDGDGALNGVEFSGCLHQLLNVERKLSEDSLNDKSACLEKFRREADTNENNAVEFSEYLRWSSEWASRCSCCCCCCSRDDGEVAGNITDRKLAPQQSCSSCCCCCCNG